MFLKLLEKLGRKKVVLDRGPSHLGWIGIIFYLETDLDGFHLIF